MTCSGAFGRLHCNVISHIGNPETFWVDITDTRSQSRYSDSGSVQQRRPPWAPFSFLVFLNPGAFRRKRKMCAFHMTGLTVLGYRQFLRPGIRFCSSGCSCGERRTENRQQCPI